MVDSAQARVDFLEFGCSSSVPSEIKVLGAAI